MSIAIIPARGGSKRIPRKNIRLFAGRPMIAWAIDMALGSALFDRVIVSTDDPEIAQVARDAGADAPFVRPASLSDDHATTIDVMEHAVRWAIDDGTAFDDATCLYATTPLLKAADIQTAKERGRQGWDFVCAALRYPCPVERGFTQTSEGAISLLRPNHIATRSQDLPTTFHDAGQFYWGKRDAWLRKAPILGPRTSFIELPPWRAQDIDTLDDWAMTEKFFQIQQSEK